MLKILLPVDGSEYGLRAAVHIVTLQKSGADIEVHLLNVQIPIDSGHARMFVSHDELQDFHREEGLAALAGVRAKLDAASVRCVPHIAVGHIAMVVEKYVTQLGIDQIVIGTHGRSGVMRALMGSVANDVLKNSSVPVTFVK